MGLVTSCAADTSSSIESIAPSTDPVGETTDTRVESPFFDGRTAILQIGSRSLAVAVADSGGERAQGLMDVTDLGELDGMLFVFEDERRVTFTMKNTLIPLDIWFISESGEIVGTAEMEPCHSNPCAKYRSPGKVDHVLETPLGVFEFAVGDVVSTVASG